MHAWGGMPGVHASPVNRMTDACENITLPKLHLRALIRIFVPQICHILQNIFVKTSIVRKTIAYLKYNDDKPASLRREAEPTVSMFTPSIIVTLRFIAQRVVVLIHATCHRPTVYNRCVVFINHLCSMCYKEVSVCISLRLEIYLCVVDRHLICIEIF